MFLFLHTLLIYTAFLLCSEFQLIHELCLYVLSASQRQELIRATLSALNAYLSWIPLGYIFESPLVRYLEYLEWKRLTSLKYKFPHYWSGYPQLETLLNFFPVPAYRNLTLQCLSEVCQFIVRIFLLSLFYCRLSN